MIYTMVTYITYYVIVIKLRWGPVVINQDVANRTGPIFLIPEFNWTLFIP